MSATRRAPRRSYSRIAVRSFSITELVYRHELRPALESGASIMDTVFQHVVREDGDDAESA